MLISNLNYLESVSEENLVQGGLVDLALNLAIPIQTQISVLSFGAQFQNANVGQGARA